MSFLEIVGLISLIIAGLYVVWHLILWIGALFLYKNRSVKASKKNIDNIKKHWDDEAKNKYEPFLKDLK